MTRPILASIDLQALKQNLTITRQAAPDSRVWSVVKANAYGHGIEPVSYTHLDVYKRQGLKIAT